jgi:hypothetical protein
MAPLERPRDVAGAIARLTDAVVGARETAGAAA